MCHESNLECKHCVTLILLELESVTQAAAFLLISGDNIPGPGHWLPGHRYRDTAGYTDMVMQSMDTEQLTVKKLRQTRLAGYFRYECSHKIMS